MRPASHQRFTAAPATYLRQESFAVYYQRDPIKEAIPILVASIWMAQQQEIAERVARILNKHWDECEPQEFRAKVKNLKPGSLTIDGAIIDHEGQKRLHGPCFIPFKDMKPARKAALGNAGWCIIRNAAHWPGIPPFQGAACVGRTSPSSRS